MCISHVSLEAIWSVLLIFSRLHYSIFLFSIIPISFNFVIGFFLLILANVWGGFMHTFH